MNNVTAIRATVETSAETLRGINAVLNPTPEMARERLETAMGFSTRSEDVLQAACIFALTVLASLTKKEGKERAHFVLEPIVKGRATDQRGQLIAWLMAFSPYAPDLDDAKRVVGFSWRRSGRFDLEGAKAMPFYTFPTKGGENRKPAKKMATADVTKLLAWQVGRVADSHHKGDVSAALIELREAIFTADFIESVKSAMGSEKHEKWADELGIDHD
jgi:hypothetical protein